MSRKPYIILCSGQSNMARITLDIPWEPPKNLKVWRYSVQKHEEGVGDSFASADANIGNYANFYGAEVARRHSDWDVYVVNISKGGANLSHWSPNAESVNMMNAIKANMSAAMGEIPQATAIDEIIWWGHESDAVPDAHVTSDRFIELFDEVFDVINEQPWIGEIKPKIRLHRLHPESNRLASQINYALECLVRRNPQRICLSDTTHFSYADNIHLDPEEKEAAAKYVIAEPVFDTSKNIVETQANLLHNGDFSEGFFPWFAKGTDAQVSVLEGVLSLNGDGKVVQKIPRGNLQSKVITLSVEGLTQDLKVQIGNHIAYVYAGEGRRQATFALHSVLRRKLRIAIQSVEGKPAELRQIKLEYGGAATPYSHNPRPRGLKASISLKARRFKRMRRQQKMNKNGVSS